MLTPASAARLPHACLTAYATRAGLLRRGAQPEAGRPAGRPGSRLRRAVHAQAHAYALAYDAFWRVTAPVGASSCPAQADVLPSRCLLHPCLRDSLPMTMVLDASLLKQTLDEAFPDMQQQYGMHKASDMPVCCKPIIRRMLSRQPMSQHIIGNPLL